MVHRYCLDNNNSGHSLNFSSVSLSKFLRGNFINFTEEVLFEGQSNVQRLVRTTWRFIGPLQILNRQTKPNPGTYQELGIVMKELEKLFFKYTFPLKTRLF
eukprot:GHVR01050952.1.p2 GENE.GHVR01050952.1~~GHVR01050952.1.p2  ORF type:complete len:101 (+),score=7.56 GHVR01050952.1:1510-1812(+)